MTEFHWLFLSVELNIVESCLLRFCTINLGGVWNGNDAMDLCICSSSKTYVPSKTVNLTINKICKKVSFNSGFCLKVFFPSFLYSEVIPMHDEMDKTLSFPGNCLSLRRALVFLLLLCTSKLISASAE